MDISVIRTWSKGEIYPGEANKKKATCAECKIKLAKGDGMRWILPRGPRAITVNRYLCSSCAENTVRADQHHFRTCRVVDDIVEFRAFILDVVWKSYFTVGPQTIFAHLRGESGPSRLVNWVIVMNDWYPRFLDAAEKNLGAIFNTENDLQWIIKGDLWRGSSTRYVYSHFVEWTGFIVRGISLIVGWRYG